LSARVSRAVWRCVWQRRNMERLTLACGGMPINSVEDLSEDMLGWAGKVRDFSLGKRLRTLPGHTQSMLILHIFKPLKRM
jgi:hypothetical protein